MGLFDLIKGKNRRPQEELPSGDPTMEGDYYYEDPQISDPSGDNVIEGEYYYVNQRGLDSGEDKDRKYTGSGMFPRMENGSKPNYKEKSTQLGKDLKRRKKIADLEEKATKNLLKKSELSLRREQASVRDKEYDLRSKQAKGAFRLIGTAAALGGVPTVQRDVRGFYFGHPKKSLYYTPSAEVDRLSGGQSLQESTMPHLGGLRQATSLRPLRESPLASTVLPGSRAQGLITKMDFGPLRGQALPKGLTGIEKAALVEIKDNNDRDTIAHIVRELGSQGYPIGEVSKAVFGLQKRGLVKKVVESKGEEPIYELAG